MDLSQFKPPVRLSMSDEEIYQALGAAQANEDGIARAMAIVEEQANLREHDNQVFAEWVAKMQASDAPQAKVALENIERSKQGLDPLPITEESAIEVETPLPSVSDEEIDEDEPVSIFAQLHEQQETPISEQPSLDETVIHEPIVEASIIEIDVTDFNDASQDVEPKLEEEFDQLLAAASEEATTSIDVSGVIEEPAVTFEQDQELITDFSVAADEDALVVEEANLAKGKKSGWWQNASYLTICLGVFAPAVIAYLASNAELAFGTALSGFALGLFINLGLYISAHFTSKRSEQSSAVLTRASFGVYGAILPGLAAVAMSIALVALAVIGGTASFSGVFDVGVGFDASLATGVRLASVIAMVALVLALILTLIPRKAFSIFNALVASAVLVAFVLAGLATRDSIDFNGLDMNVDLSATVLIGGTLALLGIATYGKAPRVVSPGKSKANTFARWTAVIATTFLVPLAVFGHFFILFDQNTPADGFSLLDVLGSINSPELVTAILWVFAVGLLALIANLASTFVDSLKTLAINNIRRLVIVGAIALVSVLVWLLPDWVTWLSLVNILTIPVAVSVGFAVAESVVRRGDYHEASLLRAYGFYGSVNWVALVGYGALVALGFGLTAPTELVPWLGYLGANPPMVPLVLVGASFAYHLATGIPRILVQQREVAEVELRKASLSEFPGFSE